MDTDAPDRLTREKLYELVWSEPMAKLALRYGLSDVGLAKICRKVRVPVPYRGYWRKKEVGQAARRTPLPKLRATDVSSSKTVVLPLCPAADEPNTTGPVVEQERFERNSENRIRVAEILADPHPLVAQTVAALRRAKTDEQGYLISRTESCLSARITLNTADRAMCVLDALLKALDGRGYVTIIRTGDRPATLVRVREEELGLSIEERVNRVKRAAPLRASHRHRLTWNSPDYEWQPTGLLTLKIEHFWGDGVRQTWADGKRQRLENCLNAFIVGLVAAAEARRAQRLQQEAREREWRAAEERRVLEARRREDEASRIRALGHAIKAWRRSRLVRDYVAEVRAAAERAGSLESNTPFADWLVWAQGYADTIDPMLHGPSVPQDPEPRAPRYGEPYSARPVFESGRQYGGVEDW